MTATLHLDSRQPFAHGRGFGDTGPYERLDGRLSFVVDPLDPANETIVDLRLAPRAGDGTVGFEADVVVLRPSDPDRGSGRVLVEAVNRGRRLVPWILNRTDAPDPTDPVIAPGDGFLFRQGFVVVHLGWQWDVFRNHVSMGLDAPRALHDGREVRGRTVVEIRPNIPERTRLLANRNHRPLPVADLEESDAVMTVRDWEDDQPRTVPRDAWAFVRETAEGDVPSRDHVTLFDGFRPGRQYHVIYTAAEAPVAGCGLLALRDAAGFLRRDSDTNPVAGRVRRVYAFGMSQSARLLRTFVHLGLNRTPDGGTAYDGIVTHVAGARRGEFNHRFAQPSVQLTPSFGHRFPFADDELTDPFDGRRDGLLVSQRRAGAVPRIVAINSSAEYWRGDASLAHTDPAGSRDLDLPPEVRAYAVASTQHGPGTVPQTDRNPNDGSHGRYGFNTVDYTPFVRAALLNLQAWVEEGVEPPPSSVPTLEEGTAVTRQAVLEQLAGFGALHLPDPERLPVLRAVDLGPEADRGIARQPVEEGQTYRAYVSAVDDDGNELAGIRLPDVTVPLGTHTGWNPRNPSTGAEEQLIPMQGFSWFLARTRNEREDRGDVRPSIAERYRDRDDYLSRVRAAGRDLIAAGYVLAEDLELLVDDAATRWDHVAAGRHLPLSPDVRR